MFSAYADAEYIPQWFLLKKKQQLKVKNLPENEGLRNNWKIIQKKCQLTLIGELKLHHEGLAKAKRDTAQRLFIQTGDFILKNKDIPQNDQKNLIKVLEATDAQISKDLGPCILAQQNVLETKLKKLREALIAQDEAKKAELEAEEQMAVDTNPPVGSAPKNALPPLTRENLLDVMRDLIGTSNRDKGRRHSDNPPPRYHPYRGGFRGRGRGGRGGRRENAIIVGRKKCASRKQEMKVADRKALCASTVRSLVAAVGSCKSRRFLSDARAVVDDNTFGKKLLAT